LFLDAVYAVAAVVGIAGLSLLVAVLSLEDRSEDA
jgi:hypothetical protein